jgi:predicted dehydrogenase
MTRTIAVIGCGSIGTRHLRNLRTLRAGRLLAVEPDAERRRAAVAASRAEPFQDAEAALAEAPDAVLVCTPPADHAATGRRALHAGAHVFIEKPLAHTTAAARTLVREAKRHHRVLAVGYNLRFESGLRRVQALRRAGTLGPLLTAHAEFGQYLPDWRPTRDHRTVYTARRAQGGGILLDASHELDTLRWLLGEPSRVVARTRVAPHLTDEVEGVADLLIRFPENVIANVHLDFVQHGYERRLKLAGTQATALWDFGQRRVQVRRPGTARPRAYSIPADANRMYLDEMRAFLRALDGKTLELASGADGLRALALVEAAQRSAATNRSVAL